MTRTWKLELGTTKGGYTKEVQPEKRVISLAINSRELQSPKKLKFL